MLKLLGKSSSINVRKVLWLSTYATSMNGRQQAAQGTPEPIQGQLPEVSAGTSQAGAVNVLLYATIPAARAIAISSAV